MEGGAIEGGAIEGGAMEGGAIEGGAIEGGVIEGGVIEGGAIEGGVIEGGVIEGGAIEGGAMEGGDILEGWEDPGRVGGGEEIGAGIEGIGGRVIGEGAGMPGAAGRALEGIKGAGRGAKVGPVGGGTPGIARPGDTPLFPAVGFGG